jgi:hypothetical protein
VLTALVEPEAEQHQKKGELMGDPQSDEADPKAVHVEAERALMTGLRASKQGSYSRRAPEPAAIPHLSRARSLLLLLLKEKADPQLLRHLSTAEECLMHYSAAVEYLERAMQFDPNSRRHDLKRLSMLRESAAFWRGLLLSPIQLRELGQYLRDRGVNAGDRSMHLTREWLAASNIDDHEAVIDALALHGGGSDFQVLENVVRG